MYYLHSCLLVGASLGIRNGLPFPKSTNEFKGGHLKYFRSIFPLSQLPKPTWPMNRACIAKKQTEHRGYILIPEYETKDSERQTVKELNSLQ